ncbi:bacteriocin immunity protein [Enterococcus dongliensis]|uniref:Bacteriocin immunity protein n=1 Tax=Enterococcus dongliensis TaxID=2559925 RepID=A0AAP5KQB5_9ENTE|nr:bacteriocin immunity protein [Enterococcus dongliensis]MDT2596443.1 bacteriocin immunity protein [Enterococcus dongliensis]MDT2604065.1 bacteriocin immunity protein [Enterococcus dongliensis]MDT2613108.1 bacteriocin immunity protein [Enterococcus dongliensis]MDT2634485.1 bacteriocin immunity protein [Enterococcus dongliensis]MDT2636435.1 bacteriocin immunity protein [Enterococcus dongliensis]
MRRDERVSQMMDQISRAYGDKQVNQHEVRKLLLENAQLLEKTEDCGLVATKICQGIAWYTLSHQHDFPKALGVLYNQLKKEAVKYDATAMSALLLPLWF